MKSLALALRAEVHKIARLEFAARDNPDRAEEHRREARILSASLSREYWSQVRGMVFTSLADGRAYQIAICSDGDYDFDPVPF